MPGLSLEDKERSRWFLLFLFLQGVVHLPDAVPLSIDDTVETV